LSHPTSRTRSQRLRQRWALEALENRVTPALHVWTDGGFTNNWSDAGNWDAAGVPTAGEPGGTIVRFPRGDATCIQDIVNLVVDRVEFTDFPGTVITLQELLVIDGSNLAENLTATTSSGQSRLEGPGELRLGFGDVVANLASGATVRVDTNINAPATAGRDLIKNGAGTLQLIRLTTNAARTIVNDGTLILENDFDSNSTVSTGGLVIGGGVGAANSAVVRLNSSEQIPDTTPITLNSDGQLQLNGNTETVGSLTFSGGNLLTSSGGELRLRGDITVNSSNGQISGNGTIDLDTVYFVNVANGINFNVSSPIVGTGALSVGGLGSVTFASPTTSTVSGLTISDATVQLSNTTLATTLNIALRGTALLTGSGNFIGTGIIDADPNTLIAPVGTISATGADIRGGLSIFLGGTQPGLEYDQLILPDANATASIAGATLSLGTFGGFTPVPGQRFTIIDRAPTAAPIVGTFANAPNDLITASGITFTINYDDNRDVVVSVAEFPFIDGTPPTGEVGVPYSFAFNFGGNPPPILDLQGQLPDGLVFDPTTGTITGTPTTAGTASGLTVTATNSLGTSQSAAFSLTIESVPTISGTPPNGTVGVAYNFMFTSTGVPAPTFSLLGSLPTGLSFDTTTGTISGTPTTAETASGLVVSASNSAGSADTPSFSITIAPFTEAPTISGTPPDGTQGVAYGFTFTSTGTPAPTFALSGTLPAGLSFNNTTGAITGTPTTAGTTSGLTVTALNSAGAASTPAFALTIAAPTEAPTISGTPPNGTVNSAYSFTFTSTGIPAPTFALTGTLPTGLSFNSATGAITGTPTNAVTFSGLVVTATNSAGSASTPAFALTIANTGTQPTITGTPPAGTVGTAYSFTFTTTGNPTLVLTGTLPTGLAFNAATGTISGTPTAAGTTSGLTVSGTNAAGSTTAGPFALTINAAPVTAPFPSKTLFVGGNGNAAQVFTFASGAATAGATVTPFGRPGTVRTAVGDVNGDGVVDLVAVTGPGGGAFLTVLNGVDNSVLVAPTDTFPGAGDLTNIGLFVAVGDTDGDGKAEIIVTPDQGGGPVVRVFRVTGTALTQVAIFLGIEDDIFRGGIRPALGDFNADGKADLVVSAGFLGGPRIAGFNGSTLNGNAPVKLFADFFAFEPELTNGAFVSAGDLDGDGQAEMIFGAGPNGGPRVRVVRFADAVASGTAAPSYANFFAFDSARRGGVRVAVKDVDGDRRADLVVGSGEGDAAAVRAYPGVSFAGNGGGSTSIIEVPVFGANVLANGVFVG
jgi:hypothetical protein